jgi:hypothetical protein
MLNFTCIYLLYHLVKHSCFFYKKNKFIKFGRVRDLDGWFNELSHEARIDLIYFRLNNKKKILS